MILPKYDEENGVANDDSVIVIESNQAHGAYSPESSTQTVCMGNAKLTAGLRRTKRGPESMYGPFRMRSAPPVSKPRVVFISFVTEHSFDKGGNNSGIRGARCQRQVASPAG